jgi:GTPase SAR1 family protein
MNKFDYEFVKNGDKLDEFPESDLECYVREFPEGDGCEITLYEEYENIDTEFISARSDSYVELDEIL